MLTNHTPILLGKRTKEFNNQYSSQSLDLCNKMIIKYISSTNCYMQYLLRGSHGGPTCFNNLFDFIFFYWGGVA